MYAYIYIYIYMYTYVYICFTCTYIPIYIYTVCISAGPFRAARLTRISCQTLQASQSLQHCNLCSLEGLQKLAAWCPCTFVVFQSCSSANRLVSDPSASIFLPSLDHVVTDAVCPWPASLAASSSQAISQPASCRPASQQPRSRFSKLPQRALCLQLLINNEHDLCHLGLTACSLRLKCLNGSE